jgi:hypothetical protein
MPHYYDHTGKPCYTYINDDGKEIDTDLRRARKENWLPSHSDIEKCTTDNSFLVNWILGQHLEWCAANPIKAGESQEDYIARAKVGGDTAGREARDFGSLVHDEMEKWALNHSYQVNEMVLPYVRAHQEWFMENIAEVIQTEYGVGCLELGVGGKIDLIGIHKDIGLVIPDWKTQNIKPDAKGRKKPAYYPSWIRQLALYSELYRRKTGQPSRVISIVIDSSEPGPCYHKLWGRDEQAWGLESEVANIVAWQKQKKYRPVGCNLDVIGH